MKATKKQIEKGKELAEKLKSAVLYINDKGEFFTSENLVQLSVNGDKKKYQKLDYSTSVVADEVISEELKEIAELETVEEVRAILDLETEGENREAIIEACEARIEELQKQ